MLKIAALAGTLALAMTGASFAQTTTGPSGQTTTTNPGMATGGAMNNPNTMAPNSATSGSNMGKTGTTGMTGNPNGSAASVPKTTTGPAGGDASQAQTPKM